MFITVNILRPVASVELCVEVEPRWAGHQDWGQSITLVVETAVEGMRNEDRVAVLTLMADGIEPRSRSLCFGGTPRVLISCCSYG